MFKRREKRSWLQWIADSLYPRGGWGRAASYVIYRIRRLPDPPYRIARGIFAGVMVTFTPFYGLHFFLATLVALLVRGNILAALMATFFGNPLTYVPIAIVSMKTGHFLLGTEFDTTVNRSLARKFIDAWWEFVGNLRAAITGHSANWSELALFYNEVLLPFTIGGIIPGIICGLIAYYLSAPVISAYQKRRLSKLRRRAEKRLAKKAADQAAQKGDS